MGNKISVNIDSISSFDFKIFCSLLNTSNFSDNVVISSFSIHQILSLLSNAAKGNTLKEFQEMLGEKDLKELNEKIRKVNESLKESNDFEKQKKAPKK